jgi:hypothetical protein
MAVHRYQARLQGVSGLPQDVYENTFYFDTDFPDGVEGICDGLSAAYPAHLPLAGISGFQVRVYELAGGQPVFQKDYPTFAMPGNTGPGEVAICLSYAAVDDPDASTRRRRGRIYLGPLGATPISSPRPNATLIDQVLDFGEAVASIGFASNTTWHLYSATDNVSAKIESIWCDDAWDTQRRRGLAPTARTVRDVQ